jgi:hypothetical protein
MRSITVFQACSIMNPYIFPENPDVGGHNIHLSAHDEHNTASGWVGRGSRAIIIDIYTTINWI